MALVCGQLVKVQRLHKVFGLAQAFFKQHAQTELRRGAALVCRLLVTAHGLGVALRHTLAFLMHLPQVELRLGHALRGSGSALGHLDLNGRSNGFLLLQ